MRTWKLMTTAVLALGLAGAMAAPAQAAPTPARHCVLASASDTTMCLGSIGDVNRLMTSKQAIPLVRFWTGYNQDPNSLPATATGQPCTGTVRSWTSLGSISGQVSSVGWNAAGQCFWQLRDSFGRTSPWGVGQWDNLATFGDGWDNRAVEYRLK
jgi:hypothetical protein